MVVLRLATGMVLLAMLVACTALKSGDRYPDDAQTEYAQRSVDYSAVQIIDTVPGPFENRIYVTVDRERQDAVLGGGVVTTIIRRDKGVAWLLIPGKKTYNELALDTTAFASIQTGFAGLRRKAVARERQDGWLTTKYACYDDTGSHVANVWLTDEGIAVKSEFFADPDSGQPKAIISLQQVRIEPQDPSLFELPSGYLDVNAR